MREIKFRAWDEEFGCFLDPAVYYIGLDGSAWFNNCADGTDYMTEQSSKLVVEQYTGLKDKNGTEIYDGDILDFDENEWGGEFTPEIIEIDNMIGTWDYCGSVTDVILYRAVIGNIHENSKLINGR